MGKQWKQWQTLTLFSQVPKFTTDDDFSHGIKRHLLLGRKAITNPDSVLKSRDITLLTKVWIVKVMVFPVVMNGCESWTIKKTENQRTDAFELWCWRSFLRVPWTDAKLKLQYFAHLKEPTYWKIQSSVQFSCSSSIIPFSSWLQYSQHQGLFQ